MKKILALTLLACCASCGSIQVKSVLIACKKEPRAFAREATEILTKNEYRVLEADEQTGKVKAFRKEYEIGMGESPVVVSSKMLEAALTSDSIKVLIYSVGRDGKTPVQYWNERATDEFEKTSYMPVLNALKDLCK
jgi:hypothetical protein